MENGERMGFVISGVARVVSSYLVIDVLGGVTRSFEVFNLEVRGDVDPGVDLREE